MRLERLLYNIVAAQAFFQRVHKKLNQALFDGQLKDVFIDVQNINTIDHEGELYACYCRYPSPILTPLGMKNRAILFGHEFVKDVSRLQTEEEQFKFFLQVLLHEMIHQYCDENGIEEGDHNENWREAAWTHELDFPNEEDEDCSNVYKKFFLDDEMK